MSDNGLYNIHDFISKIDWEGGIYGALDYGLNTRDYDIPKYLIDQWNELRDMFNDIDDLANDFMREADKFAETVPFEED